MTQVWFIPRPVRAVPTALMVLATLAFAPRGARAQPDQPTDSSVRVVVVGYLLSDSASVWATRAFATELQRHFPKRRIWFISIDHLDDWPTDQPILREDLVALAKLVRARWAVQIRPTPETATSTFTVVILDTKSPATARSIGPIRAASLAAACAELATQVLQDSTRWLQHER